MAVDAHQGGRVIRRDTIERGLRWKARARPEILIPVAPADPLAARQAGGALAHPARHRVLGLGAAQIEREAHAGQVHEMTVGVHEPRHRRAAAEVHDLLARRGVDVGAAAGEGHPPVAHDERVGDRAARVERVDPAVSQQHRVLS